MSRPAKIAVLVVVGAAAAIFAAVSARPGSSTDALVFVWVAVYVVLATLVVVLLDFIARVIRIGRSFFGDRRRL